MRPEATITTHDARLRLDTAVAALTQPGTADIDRDHHTDTRRTTETREQRQAADAAAEYEQRLVARYTDLRTRHHHAQARKVLAALIAHRQRRDEVDAQRAATRAEVPSLLDQLVAEVAASSNAGGDGGSASPYRSVLALPALEVLSAIERATAAPRDAYIATHVRTWAHDPRVDVDGAADLAEQWVQEIRALLDPPPRWTVPGACPACGKSHATVKDDTGQYVRRDTLEINRATFNARCVSCGTKWIGEAQCRSLGRVLRDQRTIGAG
jgi:hypothetical protein